MHTCFQAVSPEECLSVSGQGLGAVGMQAGVWVCSRTSPGGGPLLTETYPGRLGPHQSGSVTVFAAGTFAPIPNQILTGFNFPLHPLQVEAWWGHGGVQMAPPRVLLLLGPGWLVRQAVRVSLAEQSLPLSAAPMAPARVSSFSGGCEAALTGARAGTVVPVPHDPRQRLCDGQLRPRQASPVFQNYITWMPPMWTPCGRIWP